MTKISNGSGNLLEYCKYMGKGKEQQDTCIRYIHKYWRMEVGGLIT